MRGRLLLGDYGKSGDFTKNRPLGCWCNGDISITSEQPPFLLQNGNGFNLDQEIFAGQSGYPDPSAGRQILGREEAE